MTEESGDELSASKENTNLTKFILPFLPSNATYFNSQYDSETERFLKPLQQSKPTGNYRHTWTRKLFHLQMFWYTHYVHWINKKIREIKPSLK